MTLNELNNIPWHDKDIEAIDAYYTSDKNEDSVEYDGDNCESILTNLGWCKIGDGAFSDVYVRDDYPYVLKLSRRPDTTFAKFAIISRKNKNKHFPMIGNGKIIKIGKCRYVAYLIEKLYDLESSKVSLMSEILTRISNRAANGFDRSAIVIHSIPETLIDAAVIIGKCAKLINANIDLHSQNIMKRADGTIVISDPYVDSKRIVGRVR
jgi:hypothetical protein